MGRNWTTPLQVASGSNKQPKRPITLNGKLPMLTFETFVTCGCVSEEGV